MRCGFSYLNACELSGRGTSPPRRNNVWGDNDNNDRRGSGRDDFGRGRGGRGRDRGGFGGRDRFGCFIFVFKSFCS